MSLALSQALVVAGPPPIRGVTSPMPIVPIRGAPPPIRGVTSPMPGASRSNSPMSRQLSPTPSSRSRPLSPQTAQRSGISSPIAPGTMSPIMSLAMSPPAGYRKIPMSNRSSAESSIMSLSKRTGPQRSGLSSSDSVSSLQSQSWGSVLAQSASTITPLSRFSGRTDASSKAVVPDLGKTRGAPTELGQSVSLGKVAEAQSEVKLKQALKVNRVKHAELKDTEARCGVLREWKGQLEERCSGLQGEVDALLLEKIAMQQVITALREEVKDLRLLNEGQQEQIAHFHAVRLIEENQPKTYPYGERKIAEQPVPQTCPEKSPDPMKLQQELKVAEAREANRVAEAQEKVATLTKKLDEMDSINVRCKIEYEMQLRHKDNENKLLLAQLKEATARLAQVIDERSA